MLIIAGDITASDKMTQWKAFFDWFQVQDYKKKILIGGNHDGFLQRSLSSMQAFEWGIREDDWYDYLCDSGTEYQGLKIWGSPWTPAFCNWHFMKHTSDELKEVWDKIPNDTDILVTHGPQFSVFDLNNEGRNCGCVDLSDRIDQLPNLKLHVFGHIHESYGCGYVDGIYLAANASIMNEHYQPVNKPIRVIL